MALRLKDCFEFLRHFLQESVLFCSLKLLYLVARDSVEVEFTHMRMRYVFGYRPDVSGRWCTAHARK
jgi:hypothetical protein